MVSSTILIESWAHLNFLRYKPALEKPIQRCNFFHMFLGIVHFITATRFLMPDIIRGYVGPLESELQGAAITGCRYLVKQCINYGVDLNATEFLPASPETPTIFPEMNG